MNLQELINWNVQTQTGTSNMGQSFGILDTIDKENQSSKDAARQKLAKHLQVRSDFRKAIKSWDKTTWNKDIDDKTVRTSELSDAITDAMVFLWKDPEYMLENYWDSAWNIKLINKAKQLQNGKFSWDIENYRQWINSDLTWLITNMFPTYVNWWNFASDRATRAEQPKWTASIPEGTPVLQWDTRWWANVWDKIQNFRWSDIGLASEWRPIKSIANTIWWFVDTTQKIIPWTMDIINQITMTSPEKFNENLDNWYYTQDWVKKNAKEEYQKDVNNRWYKWTYSQRVNDKKNSYADFYNQSISNVKWVDDSRSDFWFNTMDEDMASFKTGEMWSEITQQLVLDKYLMNILWEWYKLLKWSKLVKNTKKWTELATKWATELSAPWTQLANPSLATIKNADGTINPEVVKESKDIATKIIDWVKTSPTVRWSKDAVEYQFIWDVQNGKLSDSQAYWINAAVWWVLGKILWTTKEWVDYLSNPKESLQTSLKRLWVKDTDEIINLAEIWAKDWTKPSALQTVTNQAIKEAKKNAVKERDRVWNEKLWPVRKNLPNNLGADIEKDVLDPLNESITKRWIWGKIVYKDWVASVEWNAWEYTEALKAIADKINSIKSNLEQKLELQAQWKKVDIPSSTAIYEEIYSDLKRVSLNEKDNAVKTNILWMQEDLFNTIKKELTPEQYKEYKDALEAYSKAATRVSKVEQAEKMMMNRNLTDQWVFKDGQYLSDFLNELTEQWYISNNAADRRILAIIADAFYGEPIKDSDKLIYPSLPWLMEALIRLARSKTINPKWARLPIIWEVWWWWKKFNYDYEPALWTKVVWWTAKVWSDYGIWKLSNNAADNWEED